jgi:hypothetical protein
MDILYLFIKAAAKTIRPPDPSSIIEASLNPRLLSPRLAIGFDPFERIESRNLRLKQIPPTSIGVDGMKLLEFYGLKPQDLQRDPILHNWFRYQYSNHVKRVLEEGRYELIKREEEQKRKLRKPWYESNRYDNIPVEKLYEDWRNSLYRGRFYSPPMQLYDYLYKHPELRQDLRFVIRRGFKKDINLEDPKEFDRFMRNMFEDYLTW